MAKNFIAEGRLQTVTVSAAVTGGDLYVEADVLGVVQKSVSAADITAGNDRTEIDTEGVYQLQTLAADDPIAVGVEVFWDTTGTTYPAGEVTIAAATNLRLGTVHSLSGVTERTNVRLRASSNNPAAA